MKVEILFMRNRYHYLLLGGFLTANLSLAQNNIELPELKISASEVQETVNQSEITAQDIENKQIKNLADLSRYEAGVNFSQKNNSISIRGLDSKRVLTSIDGIRTPWMTTGPRGNDGGIDAFDFNSLGQVTILRGSNATKNGSGALSSSMQLSTLNAEDILGDKDFATKIKTDYATLDKSYGINTALASKMANSTYLLQLGYQEGKEEKNKGTIDAYNYKRSKPNPANNNQANALFKAGFNVGDHNLKFTGEYFDRQKEIDARTAQGANDKNVTTYQIGKNTTTEYLRRQRLSLDHAWHNASGFIEDLSSTLYWQKINKHNDQQSFRVKNKDARANMPVFVINTQVQAKTGVNPGLTTNPYKDFEGFPNGDYVRDVHINKQIYGLNSKLNGNFALAGINNALTLGLELAQTNTEQFVKGQDNCPQGLTIDPNVTKTFGPPSCMALHGGQADMPKASSTTWAIYASNLIALNDAFSVTPAIRYDFAQHKPKQSAMFQNNANPMTLDSFSKKTFNKFTANVQTLWQINEFDYAFAAISSGFRAPEVNELYMNYGGVGTYIFLGDPNLKAEESVNYELGFNLGSDTWHVKLVAFDNYYRNFIEPGTPAIEQLTKRGLNPADYPINMTQPANLDNVRIYGAEFNAHYQIFGQLKLFNSIAYANGRDRNTKKYLNSVAPLTALWGVNFEQENSYGADVILRTVAKRSKVKDVTDFKTPGFATLDLNSYWLPSKNTKLQLGIYNILDKKYWQSSNVPDGALAQPKDYYSEGGTNAKLSFIWQY